MDPSVRIYTLLLLVFFPIHSNGYSSGRVEMACTTMMPDHDIDAQNSHPLYSLSFSSINYTGILGFTVTLGKAPGELEFSGFMIEARTPNDDTPQGRFIVDSTDNVQTLDCDTPQSAVSQTSAIKRSNVSVIWLPPVKASGNIQFRATVVQSYSVFWENVLSDVIPLAGLGSPLMAPALHHLLICSAALIYALFTI